MHMTSDASWTLQWRWVYMKSGLCLGHGAGRESSRGPKTNCVAAHSTSSLLLADLALAPDHSGSGLAPSWLPTTATIHCMSPSKTELTAAVHSFFFNTVECLPNIASHLRGYRLFRAIVLALKGKSTPKAIDPYIQTLGRFDIQMTPTFFRVWIRKWQNNNILIPEFPKSPCLIHTHGGWTIHKFWPIVSILWRQKRAAAKNLITHLCCFGCTPPSHGVLSGDRLL